MRHLEDNEQILLFEWAALNQGKYPELEWMYHIPNGGKRNAREAARLKRMGVKPGVSDVHLPIPRGVYHGLWIEMKSENGKVSPAQSRFLNAMRKHGYKAAVCYGWEEAVAIIEEYLNAKGGGT